MRIEIKELEKLFDKKVKRNINCLGFDTASRTGWCRAVTGRKYVDLDYGFIDIKTTNREYKYRQFINFVTTMVSESDKVVIEESFYGRNVKSFQMLSRMGGFVFMACHQGGVKEYDFVLATTARKYLGFKGNLKKEEFHRQLKAVIDLGFDDEDIIDAFALALVGIFKEPKQEKL